MWFKILLTFFEFVLTQYIVTPFMYAFSPVYTPLLTPIPFGSVIVFVLDNFGFVLFVALAFWTWKSLEKQYTVTEYDSNYYG